MARGVRPDRLGDESDVSVYSEAEDVWVEPSDHRPDPLVYDLNDPGCRRRRALAVLHLSRLGTPTGDLAAWLGLTPRQIRNLIKQAAGFASALGYGD